MRLFLILVFCLFLTTPVFAYRVDSVIVENILKSSKGGDVSGGTVMSKVNLLSSAPERVQLISTSLPINRVIIRPAYTNILDVYIGNQWVNTNSCGIQLGHGTAATGNCVVIETDDLSDVYINCVTGNQAVNYLAELK